MWSRDLNVPNQSHENPASSPVEDLWHIPSLSAVEPEAALDGKVEYEGSDMRSRRRPPPPPSQRRPQEQPCPIPPRCPLTVQKTALIAALLYEWLRIESVIVSRSKSVQVILGGDFSRFGLTPDLLFNQEIDQGLGLFEGEEDALLDEEVAAEEAAVIGSEEVRRDKRSNSSRKNHRSKRTKRAKKLRRYTET